MDAAHESRAGAQDFDEGVWKIVAEIGGAERHFNQMQHQYRLMASTWMLAMCAGVGFALSQQSLSVPRELVVSALGLATAIGVTQLWNLDLRVYHQLLDCCFVEGLRLETEHPWLPQLRRRMLQTQPSSPGGRPRTRPSGVLARVVWFYIFANSAALLTAFVGLAVALVDHVGSPTPRDEATLAALAAGSIFLWGGEMYRQTRSPALEAWLQETAAVGRGAEPASLHGPMRGGAR